MCCCLNLCAAACDVACAAASGARGSNCSFECARLPWRSHSWYRCSCALSEESAESNQDHVDGQRVRSEPNAKTILTSLHLAPTTDASSTAEHASSCTHRQRMMTFRLVSLQSSRKNHLIQSPPERYALAGVDRSERGWQGGQGGCLEPRPATDNIKCKPDMTPHWPQNISSSVRCLTNPLTWVPCESAANNCSRKSTRLQTSRENSYYESHAYECRCMTASLQCQ